MAVLLDPLATYIYIQHETSRICLQPRPSFAWILPLRNIIIIFPIIDQKSWSSNVLFYEKKRLYGPFSWMEFNCLKARNTLRRQFTFYHNYAPRNCWYSFFINLWTSTNNTNTEIWSKERSINPHVAKMLLHQVDEGFWLYYTNARYKNIYTNIVLFNFTVID